MVELQPDHHPVLPDTDEPVGMVGLDPRQPVGEDVGDVVDRGPDLGAGGDLEGLDRGDTSQFGAAERGDVSEAVLVEPLGGSVAEHRGGDRVHTAGEPLAGDHDVGVDAVLGDPPHLAGAHQPGLHLVGDVERVVPRAQVPDRFQVARRRKREPVGRGDRLHDHRGNVASAQRLFHRVDVTERHLDELVWLVGEEHLGEPVVAGGDRKTGVTVIGLDDRDDLAALGRMACALECDVDGLAAARSERDLGDGLRRRLHQLLGQRGTCHRREVMVTDVEVLHALGESLHDFRVAVTQVVGPPVEVHVDEPTPAHVPQEVTFPPVDDEIDAGIGPELGLVGIPELFRAFQDLGLGLERERAVVVHRAPCHEW